MDNQNTIISAGRDIDPLIKAALATVMKVDFLFDDQGHVWLMHDQPLHDILKWVEYDADMENVTLMYQDTSIQALGLHIPAKFIKQIYNAKEISVAYMQNGKIEDFANVPLITRHMG